MKNLMTMLLVLAGLQFSVDAQAKCNNATLQGTVVTAISKTVSGAPSSTMYMESWDGAGNLRYLETDSNGTSTSAPYYGTGTYVINASCIATVYYDGDTTDPWTFYVDENHTGYYWVNALHLGIVSAGQAQRISSDLLVNPNATTGPCSAATLKGTLAFGFERITSGVPQASAGMESYDGVGTLKYVQTDSDGITATTYQGTGTYTITAGCVASVYYDGATTTPYVYFVAPNGSAFWWINNQNIGQVAAGKESRVAAGLIVK